MSPENSEEVLATMNRITNHSNFEGRLGLTQQLMMEVGTWLVMPRECIEQLANKLEEEHKKKQAELEANPHIKCLIDTMYNIEQCNQRMKQCLAFLRGFAEMQEKVKEAMTNHGFNFDYKE